MFVAHWIAKAPQDGVTANPGLPPQLPLAFSSAPWRDGFNALASFAALPSSVLLWSANGGPAEAVGMAAAVVGDRWANPRRTPPLPSRKLLLLLSPAPGPSPPAKPHPRPEPPQPSPSPSRHLDPWTVNFLHGLAAFSAANTLFTLARAFTFAVAGMAAARRTHDALLRAVMLAPVSFFDRHAVGRILNRWVSA